MTGRAASVAYRGGPVFDGEILHRGKALIVEAGRVAALVPEAEAPPNAVDLSGDILAPGFVDLQVNGGGGVMFDGGADAGTLATIARAHRALGTAAILPTLITDTPEATRAAIDAAAQAVARGVAGIAGLHLEGPHLAPARKGAHDPALIRPMTDEDCDLLCGAADRLPTLMVTLAPEASTAEQVGRLRRAGVLISLGHSDASFEAALAHQAAGARLVTHLFNAMSQLGNREPGLVGAALTSGDLSAGLIADGIHVHPATMRAAWAAKTGPGRIFLVTDAMASAGSDITEFRLGGRRILRRGGRLALEDGTLAGADLDMGRAVRVLVDQVGIALADALAAATSVPARLAGLADGAGTLHVGARAEPVRIAPDLSRVTPLFPAGRHAG